MRLVGNNVYNGETVPIPPVTGRELPVGWPIIDSQISYFLTHYITAGEWYDWRSIVIVGGPNTLYCGSENTLNVPGLPMQFGSYHFYETENALAVGLLLHESRHNPGLGGWLNTGWGHEHIHPHFPPGPDEYDPKFATNTYNEAVEYFREARFEDGQTLWEYITQMSGRRPYPYR
jgi:hypothetical protein